MNLDGAFESFRDIAGQMANQMPGFFYAKDRYGHYLYSNDEFAEFAQLDSGTQLVNKRDNDLPWREQAEYLQQIDYLVYSTLDHFQNVVPIEHPEYGSFRFLTTKRRLTDRDGRVQGIVGMSVDVTGQAHFTPQASFQNGRLLLGAAFDHQHLTPQEVNVYKTILMGYSAKEAGGRLNVSPKTVEFHTDQIRKKLSCSSKGELIRVAYTNGLSEPILNHLAI